MILGLLIAFVIVSLAAWMVAMYIWWQRERGHALSPLKLEEVEHELERVARLARRGWYASTLYGARVLDWGTHRMMQLFLKLVPKARVAFQKHNELAGLEHGPSSYFLMSISEKPKKVARKTIVS